MQIDIAESLGYSWLRHVKECQIIHRNWKVIAKDNPDINDEIYTAYKNAIEEGIITHKYKNDDDLKSLIVKELKQTECDVLGVCIPEKGSRLKYHAVEVAYHIEGLNYRKGNEVKVGEKMFRIAVALKNCLNASSATLYFLSPFVRSGELEKLKRVTKKIGSVFKKSKGFSSFRVETYFNVDFYANILHAVRDNKGNNIDLSELCLRAYDLENTYRRVEKGERVEISEMDQSDLNSMKIGLRVQMQFIPLLVDACEKNRLTSTLIHEIQEVKVNGYPVLKLCDSITAKLNRRYYVTPVCLNGTNYRVCNHWIVSDEEKLNGLIMKLK